MQYSIDSIAVDQPLGLVIPSSIHRHPRQRITAQQKKKSMGILT